MIEDLELLLGMEDVDSKTYRRLELIVNATRSRLKFSLAGWTRRRRWTTSFWRFPLSGITGSDLRGFLLTVLREKAFPGRTMIFPVIWMISGHIWTAWRK